VDRRWIDAMTEQLSDDHCTIVSARLHSRNLEAPALPGLGEARDRESPPIEAPFAGRLTIVSRAGAGSTTKLPAGGDRHRSGQPA
jgi:hypothetical protein